jgi:flagellar hook-associated protein 2
LLAKNYTAGTQQNIDNQTKQAGAIATGLTSLGSAISRFQSALAVSTGLNMTMFAQSASFSDTAIGTASASASAMPGAYSFFVEKVATASQVSYANLTEDSGVTGNLVVKVGSGSFTVKLDTASTDGIASLSPREIAAAINAAPGNTSLVTASVINTGTTSELVLTARNTGAGSAIALDTSGVSGSSLSSASPKILVAAGDAIIHVGSETGTAITQASNTFSSVDGVTMSFTRAQAAGAAPLTLTVSADNGTTTSRVQSFVDAFNRLKSSLDTLVDPGDPSKGVDSGVFANDGGVRALRDRLVSMLRPAGGASLASYGILAARDGSLTVDSTKLTRQLARDPHGLDTLIGNASSSAPSGIAGTLDTFLKSWNNSSNGQIKQRQDANTSLQRSMTTRQAELDRKYDAAYQRYLTQFSQLQALQGQMSQTSSMFDSMFSNNKSNN